ncbi:acyltransferase domain-containing protein [Chloroflexi bacterium TSY]|nr:acyltransferase domain-containing protein [Chloroflexi bacterium TSY]
MDLLSLGEYNALFAAGVFDFATGLRLVKKRGELMAQARDGGHAAIIGMTEEEIRDTINKYSLQTVDIANLNSPSQVVVSGPKSAILQAQSAFESAGCDRYIPLNVSGAFHSRLMADARVNLKRLSCISPFRQSRYPSFQTCPPIHRWHDHAIARRPDYACCQLDRFHPIFNEKWCG